MGVRGTGQKHMFGSRLFQPVKKRGVAMAARRGGGGGLVEKKVTGKR